MSKIRKGQYYVWYLGWKECRGLYGRGITEPIVKELIHRRRTEDLPTLTIEVSKKELKIVQLNEKKKGKPDKVKYPPVPAKDVTYTVQALPPDEDVVACIYLGYNKETGSAVHVHVYRCDSRETASMLVGHLNQIIKIPEHEERIQRIEQELVRKGQIVMRPDNYVRGVSPAALTEDLVSDDDAHSDFSDPTRGVPFHEGSPRHPFIPRDPAAQQAMDNKSEIYDNLAEELKRKLAGQKAPILLPPKDYDTVHRMRGNAYDIDGRKCHNPAIVGKIAAADIDYTEYAPEEDMREPVIPVSPRRMPGTMQSGGSLESPVRSGSRGHQSTGSGESPISPRSGSRGKLSSGSPTSPRMNGQRYSSSGNSSAFRDDFEGYDAEIQAVSPHWKTHNQVFMPPVSSPSYDQPPPRPFSPGPHTKDLKKSYFPNSGSLPNYAKPDQRDMAPNGGAYYPADYDRPDSGYPREQPYPGKKYTATSLGLTDGQPVYMTTDPRRDRGAGQRYPQQPPDARYTSMDRQAHPAQHKGLRRSYIVDDPRGGYPQNQGYGAHQPARSASFNY